MVIPWGLLPDECGLYSPLSQASLCSDQPAQLHPAALPENISKEHLVLLLWSSPGSPGKTDPHCRAEKRVNINFIDKR